MRTSRNRINAHYEHKASEENDRAISFINKANLGWTADVCKLQRNHADYGSHCDAKPEQNLAQIESEMTLEQDRSRKGKDFSSKSGAEFDAAVKKAQKWYNNYATADEIPDQLIPESYDMRKVDGFDFTNPLRDQGSCGSCYTVSFTQVIESRLKLRYG